VFGSACVLAFRPSSESTDPGAGQGSATGAAGALRASLTGAGIDADAGHGLCKADPAFTGVQAHANLSVIAAGFGMARSWHQSDRTTPSMCHCCPAQRNASSSQPKRARSIGLRDRADGACERSGLSSQIHAIGKS